MKSILAFVALFLVIVLSSQAVASEEETSGQIEAITILSLPVDSVTIYPDGLASVKRTGSMEVTEGPHTFVLDIPRSVSMESVRFDVTDAFVEKIVYEDNPEYLLNVSSTGMHDFELNYLMSEAGYWEPLYSLHLDDDNITVSASAIVANDFGEDLEDVRLKLVAGPPQPEPVVSKAVRTYALYELDYGAPEAPVVEEEGFVRAFEPESVSAKTSATGELETLYIYELEGRKDLEMDTVVGLPLFEETAPLDRVYTWNAYFWSEGPVTETIKANNSMEDPWPSGNALLYKRGEYVTRLDVPYTPTGTEASIEVGSSADITVSKERTNYTMTEEMETIAGKGNTTHVVLVTTETSAYQLSLESNVDSNTSVEVQDRKPLKAELVSVEPEPSKTTDTGLEWGLDLEPRQKLEIVYTYKIVTKEPLEGSK